MKDINLLSSFKSDKKQFDLALQQKRATIFICILVVLLGGAYAGILYADGYYRANTEALKAEAAGYSAVTEAKARAAHSKAHIDNLDALIATAYSTSYVKTEHLNSLSSVLSENTFLSSLSVNENGNIGINGKSVTRKDITYFLFSLKETGVFSDVSVKIVNAEKQPSGSGADTYDFTVTTSLKGGVGNE